MDYTILVNKENPLPSNYVPANLVEYTEYNGEKIDVNYKTFVEKETLKSFFEMQKDALVQGYGLIIDSGYRSYDYQEQILSYNLEMLGQEAYKVIAKPGTSEHQSGLAIDIALNTGGIYNDNFDDSYAEIIWLHQNCYKYGFILRYPKNKEHITGFNYEWWHLRYVGKKISNYMFENNISTLEEYHLLNLTK